MIAALASPLARYAAMAAVFAALAGWGMVERAGRQAASLRADAASLRADAATREAAGLRETIQTMEARRRADDAVTRDPDPVRSLRDGWTRPD